MMKEKFPLIIILFLILFVSCQSNGKKSPPQINPKSNMEANIFEEGDVLTFQYPDKSYGITILLEVTRSENIPDFPIPDVHDYDFCRTTFRSEKEPAIDDLKNLRLIGYDVKQGFLGNNTRTMFYTYVVGHERLHEYANQLRKIGTIDMHNMKDRVGASTGAPDFESFRNKFDEYQEYNNEYNEYTVKEYSLSDFSIIK